MKGKNKMMINKEKLKTGIPELLLAVVSLLFMIGIRVWFPVCEVTGDSIMPCHWAGEMMKAMSILFLGLSLVHIFIPDAKTKIGIDISLAALFILTLNIPGNIIRICGNANMACRHMTQPFSVLFCIIMTVLSLLDIVFYFSLLSKEKHGRKAVGGKA